MTIGDMPDCYDCKWFEQNQPEHFPPDNDNPGFACMAYPVDIPDDIFLHGVKHDSVRSDQWGDYVFQPIEPKRGAA
jgi:hypothetical protein